MKLKNILKTSLTLGLLMTGLSSCNMDTPMNYFVDPNNPKTVTDVQNNLTGAYNQFAGYRFYGRNVVALSDIATDISQVSPSKGHFVSIHQWTFSETEVILGEIWSSGYVVIDAATDVVNDAKVLLADEGLSNGEKATLHDVMMQAYGLKAYTYYILVNIFAKDVASNGSTPGVILVKDVKPAPKEPVERATVTDTYNYILELIAAAREEAGKAGEAVSKDAVYITPKALDAMEAKVKLSMHDYAGAKTAATAALTDFKGISNEDYLAMWTTNVPSAEDIFTLKKTEDDNLSSNALNTLYGSYLATITPTVVNAVKDTDLRSQLILMSYDGDDDLDVPHPMKYDGIPNAAAVSNIRVLRYSDMYLTLAEAEANLGNLPAGTAALLNVAKRDSDVKADSFSFADKESLLKAIEMERIREFFAEGHRLFDLKRTGNAATINGVEGYVISGFAFPIPADEINAGFMTTQNDDWSKLIPKK